MRKGQNMYRIPILQINNTINGTYVPKPTLKIRNQIKKLSTDYIVLFW